MSTNTILIDCNRQQSVEVESNNETNPAIWTNKISEGLQLEPGDRVSLSSAFVNEVGSGAQTIEFTGAFVEQGVTENSLSITVQFYKCADGENCLILPRKWCWDASPDSGQTAAQQNVDEVSSRPTNYGAPPDVSGGVYQPIYRRTHDGQRYTLMEATYVDALARPEYSLHTAVVQLSAKTGHNTPDNVCQDLTQQLHLTADPASSGSTISLTSPLFRPFPCANDSNFSHAAYSGAGRWDPYEFVGVHDPELYLKGKAVTRSTVHASTEDTVTLSAAYTAANLQQYRELFAEQARRGDLIFGNGCTVDNARFLHVNAKDVSTAYHFGSDADLASGSARLFVAFDPAKSDSPADGYGFARDDGGQLRFTLAGDKIHAGITRTAGASPLGTRWIGFDTHFSAYGVDALLLWSGYKDKAYNKQAWIPGPADRIYLGAINPAISFDDTQSRFAIGQLHTARQQVNTAVAGSDPKALVHPLNPDAGKDIYQINPQFTQANVASRNMAYNPEVRLTAHAGTAPSHNLLKLWAVFDSKCGVFVSDWGVSQANWGRGLWGRMGFRWEDLNPTTTVNRNGRSTASPGSYPVTTNADVNTTQAMTYTINPYGAPQYTLQLPLVTTAALSTITVFATSTQLLASNQAKQQNDGYWLVRSSLLENPMFLDARGLSPVIAVIDKSYSSQDYIYLGDSTVDFMVTAPRTVTDIVTSLHLPDGGFASLDDRSSVIYRIVKANNVPLSIVDSFLPGRKTARK